MLTQAPEPYSPTLRVDRVTAGALAKHTHRHLILYLANAFTDKELAAWSSEPLRRTP